MNLTEKIDKIVNDIITEMTAYHGSGAKFNKFDSSYNGTGEGSSAFGPGHYFTSSKQIGKDYANEHGTSKCDIPKVEYKDMGGDPGYQGRCLYNEIDKIISLDEYNENNNYILWQTFQNAFYESETKQELLHRIYPLIIKVVKSKKDYEEDKDWYDYKLKKVLNYLNDNIVNSERSLYKVEIPEENNYADWNMDVPDEWIDFIDRLLESRPDGEMYIERLHDEMGAREDYNGKISVQQLYYSLNNMYYDATLGIKIFTLTLKHYGYVGVKYPSGQIFNTSSTKDGDMNYTVFDDKNIKITNRWDM